jgi:nucleoside-diphosphate-sugar epimerase
MADNPVYLVTGAGGFAGGYMVELLLSHGHRVRATDLQDKPPAFFPPEVEYVQADLTQLSTLEKACDGTEVIFHPASIFDFSTPREIMEEVNVGGTRNLCEVASEAGVKRMVLWSTMMIFGEEGHRDKPITEDSPRISDSIYASSKIRQEDVALRYSREGRLPVTVIRPAIIYGPRSVYGLADIFIKAKRLPIIPVVPNYKSRLCLIHVEDVVGAAYHLSSMEEAVGECYNLADDYSDLPIRDLLTLAALVLEKPVLTLPIPLAVVRWSLKTLADFTSAHEWMKVDGRPIMEQDFIHLLSMDGYGTNAKLKATGYRLKYPDWRIGLLDTAKWYRERDMW